MKIIFLDYDGVVNNLCFNEIDNFTEPNFNYPSMDKVNDRQAVAWLNKLCRETGAKIVVTSTWRMADNYQKCLRNGGLETSIEILGKTPCLHTRRGFEIQKWIDTHPEFQIEKMVILDDDADMEHLTPFLVQTDSIIGFTYYDYEKALMMLGGKQNNE